MLAFAVTIAASGPGYAGNAEHMCIVNISSGRFPNVEEDYPIGVGSRIIVFPDSPYPIIYEHPLDLRSFGARGRVWTLTDGGQLAPIQGPFPADTLYQRFIVETHSGRVIGVYELTWEEIVDRRDGSAGPPILYALDRADGSFVPLRIDGVDEIGGVFVATYVPRWRGTVMRGTGVRGEGGLFLLIDDKIERLGWLEKDLVLDISTIVDLPRHRALAIVMRDGQVVIRFDNGDKHSIEGLPLEDQPEGEIHGETNWIEEIVTESGLIAHTYKSLFYIPMNPSQDGYLPGDAALLAGPRNGDAHVYGRYRSEIGQYLVYDSTGSPMTGSEAVLFRLESESLVPIKGGTSAHIYARVPSIHPVASREQLLLNGDGSIYIYDGTGSLRRMPNSDPTEIGDFVHVYDLPTINLVVALTEYGLFRISEDNSLLPLSQAVRSTRSQGGLIVEMPSSDIAVIFTAHGVSALERSGIVTPIEGGDQVSAIARRWMNDWDIGYVPERGELVFFGEDDFYLLADRRVSGPDACMDRPATKH